MHFLIYLSNGITGAMNLAGRSSNYLLKVTVDNQGGSQNRNPGFSSPSCNALDPPDFVIWQQWMLSAPVSAHKPFCHQGLAPPHSERHLLQKSPPWEGDHHYLSSTVALTITTWWCLENQGTSLTAVFHVWWCPHYKCWLFNHFFLAIKPWHKLRKSTVLMRKVR